MRSAEARRGNCRSLPGLVGATTIAAANCEPERSKAVLVIPVGGLLCSGHASRVWVDGDLRGVAPRAQLGLVSGLACQRIGQSIRHRVTPLVIRAILQATGSFYGALTFVGGVAAVGALSWTFLSRRHPADRKSPAAGQPFRAATTCEAETRSASSAEWLRRKVCSACSHSGSVVSARSCDILSVQRGNPRSLLEVEQRHLNHPARAIALRGSVEKPKVLKPWRGLAPAPSTYPRELKSWVASNGKVRWTVVEPGF